MAFEPQKRRLSKLQSSYVIADPQNEYAVHIMKYLYEKHGLLPIVIYQNSYMELLKRSHYPDVQKFKPHAVFYLDKASLQTIAKNIEGHFNILGVVPYYDDAILPLAKLAELLNISWVPYEIMRLFRNKGQLKAKIAQVDPTVALGFFHVVEHYDDLKKLKLPKAYVIKPNDGMANRDIGFFDDKTPESVVQSYFAKDAAAYYAVEERFVGEEYAVNGQMDEKGQAHIVNIIHYQRAAANGKPNLYDLTHHVPQQDKAFEALADYAKKAMQATGLQRCPFHMEIMLTAEGPRLIEVGARFGGIRYAEMANDVHGGTFNYFAVAAHYYLFNQSLNDWGLDWHYYNHVNYLHLDGICRETRRIYRLEGIQEIEAIAEFKTWVLKPYIGMLQKKTQDLFSAAYSFHLMSQKRPQQELVQLARKIESMLKINEPRSFILKPLAVLAKARLDKMRLKLQFIYEQRLRQYVLPLSGKWPFT